MHFIEFGVVRRCVQRTVYLVDLEKPLQNEYLVAEVGVDTAENETLQVC